MNNTVVDRVFLAVQLDSKLRIVRIVLGFLNDIPKDAAQRDLGVASSSGSVFLRLGLQILHTQRFLFRLLFRLKRTE